MEEGHSMENREIEAIVREVLKAAEGGNGAVFRQPGETFPTEQKTSAEAGEISGTAAWTGSRKVIPGSGNLAAANGGLVPVTMPLALAVKLIESIEAKAAEWGMRVVTAVSDASARPVAVHCMDGAYIGSFDVALNKTYTSIAFQMSTAQLGTLSRPGESLYGIQFTNGGRIVIFGGGEVLKRGDAIVGALGVSGGSAEQDTALAAYGKSVFENLEGLSN